MPAHEFLDGTVDPAVEILQQPVALGGVCGQGHHRVAGGLLGGVVARRGQQDQERPDLLVGEPVTVHLGIDDLGHQIVARVGAAELGQLDTRAGQQQHLVDGVLRALLERGVLVVAHAEQLLGGLGDRRLVRRRHPEHVHDRGHRQPRRTGLDEVDVTDPDEVVDDPHRVGVDLLLDLTQVPRGERRADQRPVAGVFGRIHHQEKRGDALEFGRHRVQCDPLRRREQFGVLAGEDDVLTPGQRPEARLLEVEQARQRRVPAQPVTRAEAGERLVALIERPAPEIVRGDVDRTVLAGR